MNEQIGQIVRNSQEQVLGHPAELQVRKLANGYQSEWSLDGGENWNCISSLTSDPDLALMKAHSGAFLNLVHLRAKRRRADG